MKTTKKLLAMCFVAMTMMFSACSEKENEPVDIDLTGTSWEANIENVYNYQGLMEISVSGVLSMDFSSSTEGELFTDVTMSAAGMQDQSMNETEPFTYTFDGTTLTLTSTGENAVPGDNGTMTYNAADKTFFMMVPDEEIAQGMNLRDIFGSDRVVFRLVRGTVNF